MSFVDEVAARKTDKEQSTEPVRRIAANKAAQILAATNGQHWLRRSLALGGACPFVIQWERNIWIEEIRKQEAAGA